MKRFSVPAILTVTGWVEIKAATMDEAMEKAAELNDKGVDEEHMLDLEFKSELVLEELEEIKEARRHAK